MAGLRRKSQNPQKNRPATRAFSRQRTSNGIQTPDQCSDSSIHSPTAPIGGADEPQDESFSFLNLSNSFETPNVTQHNTNSQLKSPLHDFENICKNLVSDKVSDLAFGIHCYASCNFGRNYEPHMIQCTLCMLWFHGQCSDANSSQVIWTCEKCRRLPDLVSSFFNQLSELHNAFNEMVNQSNELYSTINEISTKNAQLKCENKQLKKALYEYRLSSYNNLTSNSDDNTGNSSDSTDSTDCEASKNSVVVKPKRKRKLKSQQSKKSKSSICHFTESKTLPESAEEIKASANKCIKDNRSEPIISPPKDVSNSNDYKTKENNHFVSVESCESTGTRETLHKDASAGNTNPNLAVIGNSMIRNSGSYISKSFPHVNTCVYSTSGYNLDQAVKDIPGIIDGFTKKDCVVLCLGTADIAGQETSETISRYLVLIDQIKSIAPESRIFILAIASRISQNSDTGLLNRKADSVNSMLKLLCDRDAVCTFINVNPSAIIRNYHGDGLHFNARGRHIFEEFLVNRIKKELNFPVFANIPKS